MTDPHEVVVQLRVRREGVEQPLTPAPALNRGFSETNEASFVAEGVENSTLRIDDVPLSSTTVQGVRTWTWKPGFYAGEVRAELVEASNRVRGVWRLDVSPSPDKLGRDVYDRMVDELLAADPELVVGQEAARTRLGSLGGGESALVALARLRARHVALRAALRSISREPIRALRQRRSLVPFHAVRRADLRTALGVARRPALLAAAGILPVDAVEVAGANLRVDVPDTERHLDCPANRCVAGMLRALLRRVNDVRRRLGAAVIAEQKSETVTELGNRWDTWRGFLDGAREHLIEAIRLPPFGQVTQTEITAAGLNAVSAHPMYARFWRLAWESLRTGVHGRDHEDLLPMSPTWEVYERWCFAQLCRKLEEWMPALLWRRPSFGCLEGTCEGNGRVRLRLQPTVHCTNGVSDPGFWSVSRQRVPDIVLDWDWAGRQGFVVLDAKYRVSRENVLAAMESAHIYQDALRMGERRSHMSILLVPASGGAPWLEDEAFVREHRVGVAALSPQIEPPAWLGQVLTGACEAAR